ncbi:MAG: DUF4139 domain-containing protein [Planctomycetes bacterium]|nr:DUF4139 domain-containing protein [Planctomycetota bacterium]
MMNQRQVLVGLFIGVAMCMLNQRGRAEDQPIVLDSKIESVGLFKNGLAVVRRTVEVPGNGTFDLMDLPEPVHGTFWVESPAEVVVRITLAEVAADESPIQRSTHVASLEGGRVTIHFNQEYLGSVKGRVLRWRDKTLVTSRRNHWNVYPGSISAYTGWSNRPAAESMRQTFIVLETDQGEVHIDPSTVAYFVVDEAAPPVSITRPVMRLDVTQLEEDAKSRISIFYLTRGATWAPSYALDITEPSQMRFRQKAVVRNELEPWEDVEILLISGYPAIEFGHVRSPISPSTNLSTFFRELGGRSSLTHQSRGEVRAQSVSTYSPARSAGGEIDVPLEDGIDLHYKSIGRHTLGVGDTLYMTLADTTGAYERIILWTVPDERDEWGRQTSRTTRSANADDRNSSWDSIRFRNPLERSLTTGPAMVTSNGLVLGQQTIYWTSPGEEMVLPINRTLSVRTKATELEQEDSRENVSLDGYNYRRTIINGMLDISNHRKEPVLMVIQRGLSGELISADDDPESVLLAAGAWRVNPSRELKWTLQLAPGETRQIRYQYKVMIRR